MSACVVRVNGIVVDRAAVVVMVQVSRARYRFAKPARTMLM